MPDYGDYNKNPRPESVIFFEKIIGGHKNVDNFSKLSDFKYDVNRHKGIDLRVILVNDYILGIGRVLEIIGENPDVNCIITMSNWNSYSKEAKQYCIDNDVGLFKSNEFMGAFNFENEKFFDYNPPDNSK